MKRMAIFASGGGSNALKLMEYAAETGRFTVALLVTNKAQCGAVLLAQNAGIPVLVLERERFFNGDAYLPVLQDYSIDFLTLAGFLWKIPPALVERFPKRIINLHPALLPRHGGPGMYGLHVHAAVLAAGDAESGITIHYVDELYDHGAIIFQARCPVLPGDTPETLQQRVRLLEHAHYARVAGEVAEGTP
jgi:phosphoribosylglycinamide formyltransferase 1